MKRVPPSAKMVVGTKRERVGEAKKIADGQRGEEEALMPIVALQGTWIKKETLFGVSLAIVVPTGIEPVTQGFSVLCSTN